MRARCEATGHVAALPKEALELGMIPGWEAVDGPVPNGPKAAAFPEQYDQASGETPPEEAGGDEKPPEEIKPAAKSANRKKE